MATTTHSASTEVHGNNLETHFLVWLESAMNEASEYIEAQKRLHQTTRFRNKVDEVLPINIFNASSQAEKSTTGLNSQFVFSQLLIDRLLRMKPKVKDKNELTDRCKKFYKDNPSELAIIQEFEKDYVSDRALW
ncbi:unnamed protein product [Rotaria sordida]|uniref:Uncharacterized protein n=1 Tax=Rotaria sordida TaxID=392033 RepID=A0A813WAD2_9BILA|nr:unnamed protein product [Rotaria sordida]CAF3860052.1 unnamed protein product [Rotaria sordida]